MLRRVILLPTAALALFASILVAAPPADAKNRGAAFDRPATVSF